jgi:hypothetical protein
MCGGGPAAVDQARERPAREGGDDDDRDGGELDEERHCAGSVHGISLVRGLPGESGGALW